MSDSPLRLIHQFGGQDDLVATFSMIADGGRFPVPDTMDKLARIITGVVRKSTGSDKRMSARREGGRANKDSAIYELCHLVNAADAAGFSGGDGRFMFFMAPARVVRAAFRDAFDDVDWNRPGFSVKDGFVHIRYSGVEHKISVGRMPVLAALYEFLVSMEQCGFYAQLTDIFDEMVSGSTAHADIQKASNALSSRMRAYRRKHVNWAEHEEKFNHLVRFLNDEKTGSDWEIDDAAIFRFWQMHNGQDKFKEYKTAFGAFITFLQTMRTNGLIVSAAGAARLGTDREAGDVEVSNEDSEGFSVWADPLAILSSEGLEGIKFLNKKENDKLSNLMTAGPNGLQLPLSCLRLETFGFVQSAISNNLRTRKNADSHRGYLKCENAETYAFQRAEFSRLLDHVKQQQMVVWHVLQQHRATTQSADGGENTAGAQDDGDNSNVIQLAGRAERAFRKTRRAGFGPDALDPAKNEIFGQAADALVSCADHLAMAIRCFDLVEKLDDRFAMDRDAFSTEFTRMYGEKL